MAAPAPIVVDASVAVKWYTREPFQAQAHALRDAYIAGKVDLGAPSLLPYELGNALRSNPDYGDAELERALRDLEDLQLRLAPFDTALRERAVGIAYEKGLTLSDAVYVGLAELTRATHYTADEDVVSRVAQPFVRHICDFSL